MSWLEGSRARLRLLFGRGAAESRMSKEIGFHIDMETQRLREQGLDPIEARRRALVAFGGVERHQEALRDGRGRAWFDGFSLDLKLGSRMLVKYPGLTIVGGLAMAFAICVGAVIFEVLSLFLLPTLPLPGGDRIVHIRNWDVAANRVEERALHDFTVWRGALQSVTELGAWRDVTRNLIVAGGDARPVAVAEITTSAFRVAEGAPLMGRVLVAADEQAGAPAVVVIGYELWRTRFGGDPNVLGRTVQLGNEHATVVGVMREGFEFPVAHDLWMPLRTDILDQAPRSGPEITVFGLLAPGATLETAQAELTTVGRSAAIAQRATHEHLQPRVQSYARLFFSNPSGDELGIFFTVYVFSLMLVVLVCGNVALLMFARAATRESELVMRSALGASRSRIVVQMFAEALVLGSVAAVAGLIAADVVLRHWGMEVLEVNLGRLPFWYDLRVSPLTVLFALGLTVVGSAIAGVMPALKVTRGMGSRMKQAAAGAGGLQFGGVWTAVIVAQVAVTVAFPAVVYIINWEARNVETFDVGFADEEYLAVRVDTDARIGRDANTDADREARRAVFASTLEALRLRVAADPAVAGVTFVDNLPRDGRPQAIVELSYDPSVTGRSAGVPSADAQLRLRVVTIAGIEPSYFEVLGAPILAGRAFNAADYAPDSKAVIVDQGFVDQVLQGRNPIGQQVRFLDDRDAAAVNANPWFEIVGVVNELGMGSPMRKGRAAGFYFPATADRFDDLYMLVHVRGEPMTLSPQVREIAAAVDPTLRLSQFQRLNEVTKGVEWLIGLWLRASIAMTAIALLLSLAGIYAVMSFIVARRTREIGVRVALGGSAVRIIPAILARPLAQIAVGIGVGIGMVVLLMVGVPVWRLSATQIGLTAAYAVLMAAVCMLACIVPARRALRVEPTEALRADG
jgi:putative ABC transport system permease protein